LAGKIGPDSAISLLVNGLFDRRALFTGICMLNAGFSLGYYSNSSQQYLNKTSTISQQTPGETGK
jgi:hypothetical protein